MGVGVFRTAVVPRLLGIAVASALAVSACSSSSGRSVETAEATTTSAESTTTSSVADATTTTTAGSTTVAATSPPATSPPATSPPATSPPTTKAPATGPKVVSANFSGPSACPAPDVSVSLPPPSVSITWSATGADYVYIAIDNPDGAYETNLPLNGSINNLPFGGCPASHTYYVVAVKGNQKDVKSKTFTAN